MKLIALFFVFSAYAAPDDSFLRDLKNEPEFAQRFLLSELQNESIVVPARMAPSLAESSGIGLFYKDKATVQVITSSEQSSDTGSIHLEFISPEVLERKVVQTQYDLNLTLALGCVDVQKLERKQRYGYVKQILTSTHTCTISIEAPNNLDAAANLTLLEQVASLVKSVPSGQGNLWGASPFKP